MSRSAIREFGNKRPGVYAVIENDEKRIAVIETDKGYFLPGGGVDSGESEVSALKRELLEEIGYQVSLSAEIGETVEYIKADGNEPYYQIRSRFYKVQLGRKEGESIEKDHRLIWLWPEEAIKRLTRRGQAWVVESIARG